MKDTSSRYREPWERIQSGQTVPRLRKRIAIPIALLIAVILWMSFSLDTDRSEMERDLADVTVTVKLLRDEEPTLSTVPVHEIAIAVQAFVAGRRMETRGLIEVDTISALWEACHLSLVGQKKVVDELNRIGLLSDNGRDSSQPLELRLEEGLAKIAGRPRLTAEQSVIYLERLGMSQEEMRAYLTQRLFQTDAKVYDYQRSLLRERSRLRNELTELPWGWLSARIRGTYKYLDVEDYVSR